MTYLIRPMAPGDVPTVAVIDRISFPTPWPASAFRHELKQRRSHYYVLLRPELGDATSSRQTWARWLRALFGLSKESRVIGYVGFRLQSKEGHVTTIAVHPDWRQRGLGELLLLTAIDRMMRRQVSVVSLEMRPSNQVARRLYRKYGFQRVARRRGYYRDGEDALVMVARVREDGYRTRLVEIRRRLKAQLRLRGIEVRQIEVGQNNRHTL